MSCWEILIIKTSTASAREAKSASLSGLLPDFFENNWSCYLVLLCDFLSLFDSATMTQGVQSNLSETDNVGTGSNT